MEAIGKKFKLLFTAFLCYEKEKNTSYKTQRNLMIFKKSYTKMGGVGVEMI